MAGDFFHPHVEALEREQLQQLQLERLQWQVRRCYEGSEFHRERLRKAGLVPGNLRRLEDIRALAPVTKAELRQEQAQFPPYGRYATAPPESWRELHPSTGTTGVPVNTLWSERDVHHITEFTARTMYSFGVRPGDVIQNSFSYGLWVAGMAVHYAARHLGCLCVPIGAGLTTRQIDYFRGVGSTVLLATPSYALHLAEQLRDQGISPKDLRLRIGCFGGEAGAEVSSTRRKIEEGLGIDCYDYYGLAEIGPTMASECTAKAGLHWTEDHHLIEILDPHSKQPVAEGEVGILVMTHLTREATPMLRYWTNDYARLVTVPCACGRTHARSPGGILGRADDLIIYRGAKFYPIQVEKVVRGFTELGDEFRIVLEQDERTAADRCTVQAECADSGAPPPGLGGRLRQALREECLVAPEVEILPHGSLERTTFKAKRVEDRRRQN
jgi:phenylacetate-CoA ligase